MEDIIEIIDRTGKPVTVTDNFSFKEKLWDYRWWELKVANALLKAEIECMQEAYEGPFLSGEVDVDAIYPKR